MGNPTLSQVDVNVPPFESSLERGRFAQTISIAEFHSFNVDRFVEFVKPDVAWYNGHYYPAFPPGVSLLLVPSYLIGSKYDLGQLLPYLNVAIISWLGAIFIYKSCRLLNFSQSAAIFAVFCYCLASVAWAYSMTLSAHPFSALLLALSFYIYLKLGNQRFVFLKFAALWFIYGINIFIDYPNLFILAPLMFFAVLNTIRTTHELSHVKLHVSLVPLFSTIFILPFIALFIFYNLSYYKKPIAFTNTYNLQLVERAGLSTKNLKNDIFKKIPYAKRFQPEKLLTGLKVLFISHDRGLFFFSPVFLLSIFGIFVLFKQKKFAVWPIILVIAADVLVYGSFDDPWGGWAFGPRYLIVAIPLFCVLAAAAFDYIFWRTFIAKLIILLLLAVSVLIALSGALTSNAIPPSIEAVPSQIKDNYFFSLEYLINGKTSSFMYAAFFSMLIPAFIYYLILAALILIFFVILI